MRIQIKQHLEYQTEFNELPLPMELRNLLLKEIDNYFEQFFINRQNKIQFWRIQAHLKDLVEDEPSEQIKILYNAIKDIDETVYLVF